MEEKNQQLTEIIQASGIIMTEAESIIASFSILHNDAMTLIRESADITVIDENDKEGMDKAAVARKALKRLRGDVEKERLKEEARIRDEDLRIEREKNAEKDRIEKERIAEEKRKEDARIAEELRIRKEKEETDRLAALAPDKEKLHAYAEEIRNLIAPFGLSESGQKIAIETTKKLIALSEEVKNQIEKL